MAMPDYEIQLTARPLGGEVQRQVDVALRFLHEAPLFDGEPIPP